MSEERTKRSKGKHRIGLLEAWAYFTAFAVGCGILGLMEFGSGSNFSYFLIGAPLVSGSLGAFLARVLFGRQAVLRGVLIAWLIPIGLIVYVLIRAVIDAGRF